MILGDVQLDSDHPRIRFEHLQEYVVKRRLVLEQQKRRAEPGPGPVYYADYRAVGPKICKVYRSGARPVPALL